MSKSYQRAAVRRPQIFEATLALISESGLHTLTTRRIAERVGLSEAALFRHFADKQAILDGCLDHLESLMFPEPLDVDTDPMMRLERYFRQRVALVAGPMAVGHLVFSEQLVYATGEPGRRRIAAWRQRSATLVGGILAELAQQGRLRDGFTPEALVPLVQGQVLTFVADRLVAPLEDRALDLRIDRAWRLLEAVLTGPSPPGDRPHLPQTRLQSGPSHNMDKIRT